MRDRRVTSRENKQQNVTVNMKCDLKTDVHCAQILKADFVHDFIYM